MLLQHNHNAEGSCSEQPVLVGILEVHITCWNKMVVFLLTFSQKCQAMS